MDFQITAARTEQLEPILELFPRLASFRIPERRQPEHLWQDDAKLLRRWGAGELPEATVLVAEDADDSLLGIAFARLRPELLSQEPSAHLEALVVADGAEGRGVGGALVAAVEASVKAQGAKTLTLHVFGGNQRARGLYRRMGFEEELLRCIKDL